MAKPLILLTNDDGIYAAGILAAWQELRKIGDVEVVAPDAERSAVGHAIALLLPLRAKEVVRRNVRFGYAVNGMPADCVKIAVKAILPRPPDLVVSGINLGSNTGTNVIYSGTVSAATEARILGIPSIAVSLATFPSRFHLRSTVHSQARARRHRQGVARQDPAQCQCAEHTRGQDQGCRHHATGRLTRRGALRKADRSPQPDLLLAGRDLQDPGTGGARRHQDGERGVRLDHAGAVRPDRLPGDRLAGALEPPALTNRIRQHAAPLDLRLHHVAGLQILGWFAAIADTLWGPGRDAVSGFERHPGGKIGDDPGHGEDHVPGVAVLLGDPVDRQAQA